MSPEQSLRELVEICRWKCRPDDEIILPNGKTSHQALIDAVQILEQLDAPPQHEKNCGHPWCTTCYGESPRIVSDGNYSP